MGTFLSGSKRVIVKNTYTNTVLQIDVPTTLSFYIAERVNQTEISTISYKVDKISGRANTPVTQWESVDLSSSHDNIYVFDYTISGVTPSDNIEFTFKVVDVDGDEFFAPINDIDLVV